jgi:hypothetical protein
MRSGNSLYASGGWPIVQMHNARIGRVGFWIDEQYAQVPLLAAQDHLVGVEGSINWEFMSDERLDRQFPPER